MNTFFTSDTHFFHHAVISYSNRPYKDIQDMHDQLIYNWNNTVGSTDLVYHLGDFFLTTDLLLIDNVLEQLNGRIRLIKGNHDRWIKGIKRLKHASKIEWIKDYHEENGYIGTIKTKTVLIHYPMRAWNKSHYGSIQLHGHCHGNIDQENRNLKRMDVGVDSEYGQYAPIPLDYILDELLNRKETNHHPEQFEP